MKALDSCTVGFIGAGVMGGALIAASAKVIAGKNILVADISREKTLAICDTFGCTPAAGNIDLARRCDIIFLAVKPAQIPATAKEIAGEVSGKTVVSIAAGVPLASLKEHLSGPGGASSGGALSAAAIIRLMPNLPATVGEGMIALCALGEPPGRERESARVKELLKKAGRVEEIDEHLMDSVTALSGSCPAYAFMFAEALADAAVLLGMPRKDAYTYAAQTLKGAATMLLETGRHPADLKDAVCSPAGTTIEAVRILEQKGFRSAITEAAIAAGEKSARLAGA